MEDQSLVKENHRLTYRRAHLAALAFSTLLTLLGAATGHAASPAIHLSDAAEQGAFNEGAAQVAVSRVFDPTVGGDVVQLDYRLPRGMAAGFWAKAFPERLRPDSFELVRLGLKTADPNQSRQIAVRVEIKGTVGIQQIPLHLQPSWTFLEETVDWQKIGTLTEVVALVSRLGDDESAVGTVYLDVRFDQLPLLRKLSMSPGARIGGVLLVSIFGALLTALLQGLSGRRPGRETTCAASAFPEQLPGPGGDAHA
jgi:cyclic beta-1,2-glucan synthetase